MRPSTAAALLIAGCATSLGDDDAVATAQQGLGEPFTVAGGQVFPSWEERVLFVLTNRARSSPQQQEAECVPGQYHGCPWAESAGGTCYAPMPPLVYDVTLSRSARFHATYLTKAPAGLAHETCCTLRSDIDATGCDGDPACACVAGTQASTCGGCTGATTGAFTRMSRFGVSGTGEVAHQFYLDPVEIFHGWVDEALVQPPSTACGFGQGNGHRWLILTSSGPRVGVGHHRGASGCNTPYWVQDFGGAAAAIPRVPGAIHYPHSGAAGSAFTFWANYWQPGGGAPTRAAVVVDGACTTLSREFGTDQNGTFSVSAGLGAGCRSYYFVFVGSDGLRVTYPSTGSLTVGVGAACASDYVATQQPADCEGGGAGGGGGGAAGGAAGGMSGTAGGTAGAAGGMTGAAGGTSGGAAGGTTGAAGGMSGSAGGTSGGAAGGMTGAAGGTSGGAAGGMSGAAGGTSGAAGGMNGVAGGASGAAGGTSSGTAGGTANAGGAEPPGDTAGGGTAHADAGTTLRGSTRITVEDTADVVGTCGCRSSPPASVLMAVMLVGRSLRGRARRRRAR